MAQVAGSLDDLPKLAYRYVLSQFPPHSLLVGTARREELRAVLDYAAAGPLDAAMVHAIREVPPPDEDWLNPGNWPEGS
jgi:hypothetical protein